MQIKADQEGALRGIEERRVASEKARRASGIGIDIGAGADTTGAGTVKGGGSGRADTMGACTVKGGGSGRADTMGAGTVEAAAEQTHWEPAQ